MLVYEAVKTTLNDQVGGGYRKGHLGVNFLRGSMSAEVMGCERRFEYYVEQGLPVDIQECLERFH